MRYALLIVDPESANPSADGPPMEVQAQVTAEYNAYTQMLRDRGAFLGGEALQPNPTATTVRVTDGRTLTTDGPFIEAKEALGGFYLIEARDLDEAIALAAECPGAKHGAIEIRPVLEYGDDAEAVPAGAESSRPA